MTGTIIERQKRVVKSAAVVARLTKTVGGMVDHLDALRESKRALEEEIKKIEAEYAGTEETLTKAMDEQGLAKASGKRATVSFTSNVVAQVEDWETFIGWVIETKNGQLVQRRVSDPAYRELRELGQVVPGATDFVKKRLNLRSI